MNESITALLMAAAIGFFAQTLLGFFWNLINGSQAQASDEEMLEKTINQFVEASKTIEQSLSALTDRDEAEVERLLAIATAGDIMGIWNSIKSSHDHVQALETLYGSRIARIFFDAGLKFTGTKDADNDE
jgi:hypothetical protein